MAALGYTQVGYGAGGAPTGASFVTLGADGDLTAERVFTPSARFSVVDGGANGTYAFDLASGVVAPGSYTLASITVDTYGRVTAASSGTPGIDGSGAANRLAYWSDADTLTSSANLTFDGSAFAVQAATVFNEAGATVDWRVESDTQTHGFYVDGTNNRFFMGGLTGWQVDGSRFGWGVAAGGLDTYTGLVRTNQTAETNFAVENGSGGNNAVATLLVVNDNNYKLRQAVYGSGNSGSYITGVTKANLAVMESTGSAPLLIGTSGAQALYVETNATLRGTVTSTGQWNLTIVPVDPTVVGMDITGTMPSSATSTNLGVRFNLTGAGSSSQAVLATAFRLNAGYTGNKLAIVGDFRNFSAGTGTDPIQNLDGGNLGIYSSSTATTSGHNLGGLSYATGGAVNYGWVGLAYTDQNNADNVGLVGIGRNGGSSSKEVGVVAMLGNVAPTLISAALLVDNTDRALPIALYRANSVTVGAWTAGGNLVVGAAAAGATATKVLALSNSATAPSASADLAHLYCADISAGNAAFACYQEAAVAAAVAVASTHKWPVVINGTTYYILMTNVA